MSNSRFQKQTVKVQSRSGFDKSFKNLLSAKVGTIVPILCDELIPNTHVYLKAAMSAALPPLASDTFMNVNLKYASFFVPTRILFQGYSDFLTGKEIYSNIKVCPPYIEFPTTTTSTQFKKYLGPGTLADYLGIKMTSDGAEKLTVPVSKVTFSALPFLAYHHVYNSWFRNARIQNDIFSKYLPSANYNVRNSRFVVPLSGGSSVASQISYLDPTINSGPSSHACLFNDGVHLMELRQANFENDLFTSAFSSAQSGDAQEVELQLPEDPTEGTSFSISAFRAANSLQQFLERNNLASDRLVDYVKVNYGADLSDGVAQRPILLGSGQFSVYNKGIFQTSNSASSTSVSQNPFNSVGSKFGYAYADGTDNLVDDFTAQEPGYLFVVAWLSPRVTYGTGVNPMFLRYLSPNSRVEMANPILQNVGNEPILCAFLNDRSVADNLRNNVFGYSDRYFSFKDRVDEIHGILRDGESLESFALQRNFSVNGAVVTISDDFLKIPTTYLDQVSAVEGDVSKYGYWLDCYFDYKVSMPLSVYSIPSLQDPAYEHGTEVSVNPNGKTLA